MFHKKYQQKNSPEYILVCFVCVSISWNFVDNPNLFLKVK